MNPLLVRLVVVALGASLLVLGGCSFGRERTTKMYVLTSLPGAQAVHSEAATDHGAAIGVGPVELPKYLNRPQIVTHASRNELHLAEFDLWAEPLEGNFSRILVENLSSLLAPDRIAVYPWNEPVSTEYRVTVEVTRFDGEADGTTSLVARWSIVGKDGKEVLMSRKSNFSQSAGAQDYEATVSAMSRTVADLSRDIAAAIKTILQKAPNP